MTVARLLNYNAAACTSLQLNSTCTTVSLQVALYHFFKPTNKPFLPNPELETDLGSAGEIRHTNRSVEHALESAPLKGHFQLLMSGT